MGIDLMPEGELMTLSDAARWLDPSGAIKVRSLRTEAERGRLSIVSIAGKHFVTENALREMVEKCRAKAKVPDCTSTSDQIVSRNGSLETERTASAQAAARLTVEALKARSRNT